MGGTIPISQSRHKKPATLLHTGTGGIIPLQNITVLILAIIFSLLFILALSCSFLGDDEDEPYFKRILNDIEVHNPGIVLLGENVDVDIDEPSITVSWSIIACGDNLELNESAGIHESTCGLPSMYLQFYVDNSPDPVFVYDPTLIPTIQQTGRRRSIENLVRFDSDYTLDVHNARLYPFDNYYLASTLRAVNASNATIPIQKLHTIDQVTSFLVASSDMDSYQNTPNGTQVPTRDLDLWVQRPGQAQTFAFVLFAISWMLTHVTIGHVLLARRLIDTTPKIKHLISTFAILLAIPQLRNSMPDSPGFDDGALIDYVGFFPQMIISALSLLTLLLLIMMREYDELEDNHVTSGITPLPPRPLSPPPPPSPSPRTPKLFSPPPTPTVSLLKPPSLKPFILRTKVRTSSVSMECGEAPHMTDDLNTSFIFPPTPPATRTIHHRSRSSRTRFDSTEPGGQPGVYVPKLSKPNTALQSLKER
ncbi:hypothetical protein AZE42_03076 [Rhizopogon vesiculosus]|uniref:Transmembrane protein n=1 Tax=Rhizopogon vesiculosus TaxID=180088 RepID=A0A1J8QIY6_9AGAM|nr:hypothetical protein AZE42_03076 [Rhizopogon vesiculosus]